MDFLPGVLENQARGPGFGKPSPTVIRVIIVCSLHLDSSCTTVRLDTYKQTGICSSGRRSLASEEEDEVVVLVSEDVDLLVILIGTRSPSNVYFLKPGRGKVVPVLYHPQTTIETSLAEHILFIHAISGCDSTSALFNQGKVKALRTVVKNPDLLPYIRRFLDPASTTREITEAGERFLVILYGGNHETTSLNKLRYKSYVTSAFKVTSYIAALPPTESAAKSILRYGVTVYTFAPKTAIAPLMSIQNKIKMFLFHHIRNEEDNIMNPEQLAQFQLIYDNFHNEEFRQSITHSYPLRHENFKKTFTYNKFGERKLSFKIPMLLNQFCQDFISEENKNLLKKKLKSSILKQ
ncbi:hypothetical protein M8J77_014729 [Diaphorina citri]|nr:hypothetical protein M8J77_014729 [Diaphorina citri]